MNSRNYRRRWSWLLCLYNYYTSYNTLGSFLAHNHYETLDRLSISPRPLLHILVAAAPIYLLIPSLCFQSMSAI